MIIVSKLKKAFAALALGMCGIILTSGVGFAAENTKYADELYELKLFRGTENGYELEKTVTREEAATVIVRLLGEENNLTNSNQSEKFTDVLSDRWSYPYVMYCYDNSITKGTGNSTYSPEDLVTAEEFLTLVLRTLGYTDAEPESAYTDSVYKGLVNSEIVRELKESNDFTRDDMVYIMYKSLMAKNTDGDVLANVLAKKGVISKKRAEKFDIYKIDDIDTLLDQLLG